MARTKVFTNDREIFRLANACSFEKIKAAYEDWAHACPPDKILDHTTAMKQLEVFAQDYNNWCDLLKREYVHYEYCQRVGGFQTMNKGEALKEEVDGCSAVRKRNEPELDNIEKAWRQVDKKFRRILKIRHQQLVTKVKAERRRGFTLEADDTSEGLNFEASGNSNDEAQRSRNGDFTRAKRSLLQRNASFIHAVKAKRDQRQSREDRKQQRVGAAANKDAESTFEQDFLEHQNPMASWGSDGDQGAGNTPEHELMGVDRHGGRKSKRVSSRAQLNVDAVEEYIDYILAISQPRPQAREFSPKEVVSEDGATTKSGPATPFVL